LQCVENRRIHDLPNTGAVVIGRESNCHLILDDKQVSRIHARIIRDSDGVTIEDLGSTNGTKVNYTRIVSKRLLRPGDIIVIGDHSFRLFCPDDQVEGTMIHRRNAGLEDSYFIEEETSDKTSLRQAMPLPPDWPDEPTVDLSEITRVLAEPAVCRMLEEIERHQKAVPAALIGADRTRKGQVILLKGHSGPTWKLGRGPDCALHLNDRTLSEEHAELSLNNGVWLIRDLNSKNGTLVNGNRIHEATIKQHDVIEFGEVVVIFHLA
jgi:pSer/pThr/pTyr-binding forkhead associated (FHA) protein